MPLVSQDEEVQEVESKYFIQRSFALYACQIFLMCLTLYFCVQDEKLVETLRDKITFMVFCACYLITTMVLVADVDLQCQRVKPLNYVLWFSQSISASFMTCFIAIKLNTNFIITMLAILLLISIIYAMFGSIASDGTCSPKLFL